MGWWGDDSWVLGLNWGESGAAYLGEEDSGRKKHGHGVSRAQLQTL